MRRTTRLAMAALLLGVLAMPLAACSGVNKTTMLDVPTFTSTQRATLRESSFDLDEATADLDSDALHAVGDSYRRAGEGTVSVAVSYDPKSRANSAAHATDEAARIARVLRKSGVDDVKTEILPASPRGEKSRTMISFKTLMAEAPDGCYSMGGVGKKPTGIDRDYPIGCTTRTLMAQQIARPRDMKGRAGLDQQGSARRQYLVSEPYKEGKPNAPLTDTESATESN